MVHQNLNSKWPAFSYLSVAPGISHCQIHANNSALIEDPVLEQGGTFAHYLDLGPLTIFTDRPFRGQDQALPTGRFLHRLHWG